MTGSAQGYRWRRARSCEGTRGIGALGSVWLWSLDTRTFGGKEEVTVLATVGFLVGDVDGGETLANSTSGLISSKDTLTTSGDGGSSGHQFFGVIGHDVCVLS
eukprot:TRINITY_DN447_c0_g1_i3.p2 TRINITY_DN447_c0_g1~~TRINITY_DN447_c0_g1_i3.p2  ORF type:complete len:103 (-),score=1.26 TRINITY_DN447_c0_g1_i3:72-380(-)